MLLGLLAAIAAAPIFWLIVPQNSSNEGSYGWSSTDERLPALVPCKPQAMEVCP